MVAQYQYMLVAEPRQPAAALLGVQSDAFEIMVADAAIELGTVEVVVIEAAPLHGDRGYGRRMRMSDAGHIRAALVNRTVQGEAGGIGRIFGRLDQPAVDAHFQQILRRDLAIV